MFTNSIPTAQKYYICFTKENILISFREAIATDFEKYIVVKLQKIVRLNLKVHIIEIIL
jgi:hypothetical protein